jgi:hypothetical protein
MSSAPPVEGFRRHGGECMSFRFLRERLAPATLPHLRMSRSLLPFASPRMSSKSPARRTSGSRGVARAPHLLLLVALAPIDLDQPGLTHSDPSLEVGWIQLHVSAVSAALACSQIRGQARTR